MSGLKPLLQKVASVTPRRRLGLAAGSAIFPVFMAGAMLFGQLMLRHFAQEQPDVVPLQVCLFLLDRLEKQSDGKDPPRERQALEVYIAGRFGKTISDPATWSSFFAATISPDLRARAKEIVAKHPNPPEKDFAEAKAVAEPLVGGPDMTNFLVGRSPLPLIGLQAGIMTVLVAIVSLVCALAFRCGLAMLLFGVVVAKRDGSRAGRLRVFWRALVTWAPVLLGLVGAVALALTLFGNPAVPGDDVIMGTASALALALFAALAILSALLPERGIQDRLAGTWLVPR